LLLYLREQENEKNKREREENNKLVKVEVNIFRSITTQLSPSRVFTKNIRTFIAQIFKALFERSLQKETAIFVRSLYSPVK